MLPPCVTKPAGEPQTGHVIYATLSPLFGTLTHRKFTNPACDHPRAIVFAINFLLRSVAATAVMSSGTSARAMGSSEESHICGLLDTRVHLLPHLRTLFHTTVTEMASSGAIRNCLHMVYGDRANRETCVSPLSWSDQPGANVFIV
jgi:hypothetical protein